MTAGFGGQALLPVTRAGMTLSLLNRLLPVALEKTKID